MTIGPTTGANKAKNLENLQIPHDGNTYQSPGPEAIPKRVASLLRAMHTV